MIKNWEIASRINHDSGELHYTLLMDGTEQDARLIAKKLKGYIQSTQPAQAPYVYAFELPVDMDEGTQDKLRAAVEEGVELTNKINQFVPGGVLGDPLFNANVTQDDKVFPAFVTLDPSASNVEDSSSSASSKRPPIDLSSVPDLTTEPIAQVRQVRMSENLAETVARDVIPPAQPSTVADTGTLSISDKDMLIEDMEGSVLEKMPLADILSAQTKYDMFVDVDAQAASLPTQKQKKEKLEALQQEKIDTFNVFEPEVQEPGSTQDVKEVQEITNRLAKKNMDFIKKPNAPSQDSSSAASQQPAAPSSHGAPQAQGPFTSGASKEKKDPSADKAPVQEEAVGNTLPPASALDDENLPEITVREDPKVLTKTFHVETAVNEKLMRPQPQAPAAPQGPGPAAPSTANPASTKTVLHLKKPADSAVSGKTILHLRRKNPAPQEQVAQTLKSTMSPQRAAEVYRTAKEKGIDHSIEIPLSELKKHNWPLEVPLVPTYTLSNMVMSVNRFAHATAVSVIDSPGKLYNPLVLHGGTGTGKTHFLNALAYALSQKFGQEHIFMTNGVRLSRGIQRYVLEGNIDKFENFMSSVRALLIDDIHLLAINEQNRSFISKLLNTFIQEQKQIVITSKYPPESLEKLEELIKFKLDCGWISELKSPTGATHFRIVKKMLIENGVDLNDQQIEDFFSAPHMTLGTITRSIRRLKVLENLIFPHLAEDKQSHAAIFEKLLATKGEDASSELINKNPQEITGISTVGNGEWGRIGFFYPQNCSDMMNWMVYALEQRAKELGIEGGFDIVVRSSYATENIISSAFKIANLCDNKKLKGAVILGPQPNTCDPSVRENFYDILTHMLEIMLIRCGIINYENVRQPSTYVKVISELMR